MKRIKILLPICTVIFMGLLYGCSPAKKDGAENTNETAKEANEEIIEDKDLEKDADFIVEAVAANYAEIHLAQQALGRSQDAEAQKMATMLVTDHTKVLNELKAYASKNGIVLPVEETDKAKKDEQKLSEKDAEDFDKKWCSELIDAHQNTIDKFEKRVDRTEDPELKTWISNTLPSLKMHLQMLKDHKEKIKDAK